MQTENVTEIATEEPTAAVAAEEHGCRAPKGAADPTGTPGPAGPAADPLAAIDEEQVLAAIAADAHAQLETYQRAKLARQQVAVQQQQLQGLEQHCATLARQVEQIGQTGVPAAHAALVRLAEERHVAAGLFRAHDAAAVLMVAFGYLNQLLQLRDRRAQLEKQQRVLQTAQHPVGTTSRWRDSTTAAEL